MVRGKKKIIHNVELQTAIHNRFDIEVIDAKTGTLKQKAVAYNTICNSLWPRMGSSNWFNYIHYGSGTGTPAATDTSLFSFVSAVAVTIPSSLTVNDAAHTISATVEIQLAPETSVGVNISEVGIGYSNTANSLVTHAMLKDANGNAISIQKTALDIINIHSTVFLHWPAEYSSPNSPIQMALPNPVPINSNGVYSLWDTLFGFRSISSYNIRITYTALYGRYTPGSSSGSSIMAVTPTFDASTKKFTFPVARFPVSSGNVANGIGGITISGRIDGRCPIMYLNSGSGWYAGTDIVGEAVGTGDGTTKDFVTKYEFPENAKVYIDGVLDTTATVEKVPLRISQMQTYFEMLRIVDGIEYPALPNELPSDYDHTGRGDSFCFKNPFWEYGIATNYFQGGTLYASDDGATWDQTAISINGNGSVPEGYRYRKYYKYAPGFINCNVESTLTGKNIHFTTPPASGAAITIDYHTPKIAKDTDHVFDIGVTFQMGEYTGV